ncbi:MAG: sn-glycerol-3-phosphate ABC transporter ATP-binding protein UgpC [Clostridia bacterium]|nr:sn-glycerol-3-phosphate ABC transporter ATP-binding protein UgpC [Clostridia bacterium]
MAGIKIRNLQKVYRDGKDRTFEAVKKINLDIEDRDFVVFVGPSGCGKTTTLRMIAGLEDITDGEIYIEDNLINHVEPKDRNIAMVFQNYALYPHMSVYDNIAFGLKNRKVDRKTIQQKVEEVSTVLDIKKELHRRPKELSGGQKQRVAMGRAMVREPKVFLMDEPLSNLDAKLRVQMRNELIKLHRDFDATFIFVTHDQVEAMTLANKIVIMNEGEIMQVDSPENIFNKPANTFVAGFIGSPQMNLIKGTFNERNFTSDAFRLPLENLSLNTTLKDETPLILGIRPEHFEVVQKADSTTLVLTVHITENMGSYQNIYCHLNDQSVTIQTSDHHNFAVGDELIVKPINGKIHLFDGKTEKTLLTI